MNLGELSRPITIYWDLTPTSQLLPDYARISEQVAAVKPLQLHLLDGGPQLSAACLTIIEHLRNTPLSVTLTAKPEALAADVLDRLHGLSLRALQMHADSYAGLAEIPSLREATGGRFTTGIAFQASRANWLELPMVVQFCLDQGIPSLTLPMQRLYGNEPFFMPTVQEMATLNGLLAGLDYSALRLTIHDPFLWRAFNPNTPFPGGGCQAGNTMLAIAPDGIVYPCPALPLALGSLADTTLKELAAGEAKKRLRTAVTTLPDGCRGCADEMGCHGGCRGRSLVLSGDIARPDPACETAIHEKG